MAAILERTSDIAIWAEGYSSRELYANALWQMSDLMMPGHCQKAAHYDCLMRVDIHAPNPKSLLIDFLSEALALTYIQHALFCHVYFDVLNESHLRARLYGRWFGNLEKKIRAVTYHGARITKQHGGRWGTPVVFDL
jgi:SHS2 domain-containing protein